MLNHFINGRVAFCTWGSSRSQAGQAMQRVDRTQTEESDENIQHQPIGVSQSAIHRLVQRSHGGTRMTIAQRAPLAYA